MSGMTMQIAGGLAFGLVVGAAHAAFLYRAVVALIAGPRTPALAIFHAVRLGFIVLAFWLAAQAGAAALVSAAAGFTLAQLAARQITASRDA